MFLENIPAKKSFLKDFMGYIPSESMEWHSTTDGVVFFTHTRLIVLQWEELQREKNTVECCYWKQTFLIGGILTNR